MKRLIVINLMVFLSVELVAQNCEIEHITDKIISCKCNYYEEHRAFYVISDDGIVSIDTYYYPWLTKESRDIVRQETGRDDFIFLLNTHGHGCHVGGNLIYKDVPIIGHDSVTTNIIKVRNYHLKEYNSLKEKAQTDSSKIKALNDYEMLVNIPSPTKTFSDSTSINLSDLTIEMHYFGFSGHSNDETLIYIPEEKTLIIGQILGRSYFLPVVKEQCSDYDLKRKIAVLSGLFTKDIEHILSNHQGEIKMNDLIFARDYLNKLLTLIPVMIRDGKNINDIKNEFKLDKKYPELAERHEISESLIKNNDSNIESIWKMLMNEGK